MAGKAEQRKMLRLEVPEEASELRVYWIDKTGLPFYGVRTVKLTELEPVPPATFESGQPWHPACTNRLGCGYSERFEECIGCPYRQNGPTE